jgi:hypothetical protein
MVKSLTFLTGFSGKTLPNRLGMVDETLSSSWQKAIPYSQDSMEVRDEGKSFHLSGSGNWSFDYNA